MATGNVLMNKFAFNIGANSPLPALIHDFNNLLNCNTCVSNDVGDVQRCVMSSVRVAMGSPNSVLDMNLSVKNLTRQ